MAAPLALIWNLIATDEASPVFGRVAANADKAAASTGKAETGIASFGKKAGAALGALVSIDIAAHMIKSAAQFQRSMLLIQTQAGASAAEVRKMTPALLALAGPLGTAPEALATSLYHVESVGLRGAKALDVVKIAAEGAKVGNADLEETTNALTSAVASGIPGVQSFSQAMGALNAIVGSGDMHLSDLNEALGTGILTKAKTYGLSLTDVGAALATFGDLNIRGADAATQLRMAFEAMAKPAKGGADVLAKWGLSVTQLRTDMQQGGLTKALLDLRTHLADAGITGTKVGGALLDAFGKKGASGVTLLLTNFARYETKMADITKGAGGFGSAWQATTKTASFAFDRIKADVESFGISLGLKLLPAVTAAAQWLGTTLPHDLSVLSTMLQPTIHAVGVVFAGAWTACVAVMSVAAKVLGEIGSIAAANKGAITNLGEAALVTWAAFKGASLARIGILVLGDSLVTLKAKALAAAAAAREVAAGTKAVSMAQFAAGLAAVGVAIYAAGKSLSNFLERGNSFAHVMDNLTGIESSFKSALDASNGALNTQVARAVAAQLQSAGLADKAHAAGISTNELTAAVTGNDAAMDSLISKWKASGKPSGDTIVALGLMHGEYSKTAAGAKDLATVTAASAAATKALTGATNQANGVLQYNIDAHGRLVTSMAKAGSALDNTTAAMARQTVASGILKNALDYLNGVNESVESSTDTFKIALGQLANRTALVKDANGHYVTSLKQSSVAGAQNRQTIVSLIDAAKSQAQAVADQARQNGASLPDALAKGNAALAQNETAIRAAAKAAHLNTGQVDDLLSSLGHLAKISVHPKIALTGAASIQAQVNAILAQLKRIPSNMVVAINSQNKRAGMVGYASGSSNVPDGMFLLGERGPEVGVKRGNHLEIIPNGNLHKAGAYVAGQSADTALLREISGKLDALGGVGDDVAGALNAVGRSAAMRGRTAPVGRGW